PSSADNNTTNQIIVQVTDDGEPPLSASATFAVVVRPRPLLGVSIFGNTATLTWNAIPNTTYRAQYKTNLSNVIWETFGPQITATNSVGTATDAFSSTVPQRFYRIMVISVP